MKKYILTLLPALFSFPALAQVPASTAPAQFQCRIPAIQVAPAAELADAAQACVKARLRQGQSTAAVTTTSVQHRIKMDRYDVKWYKLDLALENNSRAIAGSGLMRVQVGAQALDSVAFELYQAPAGSAAGTATFVIDSVVAGGKRSPGVLRRGNDATAALRLPAAAGSLLDVRIYYHGTAPNGNSAAIGNAFNTASQYYQNNTPYPYNVTWSLSEPFSAHEWFPCKQVLTDKADSSAVSVTTTLPNKVGSNGLLRHTVLLPGNKVRYEWSSRYPIDYYLISVAVAPYVEYTNYAHPAGGPTIPILNYAYDQRTLTYYQAEFDRIPGFIENYSALFGTYFFANEKYGLSLAPIGGGMEHQTMTTQDGLNFTLTAHELFHQWFGDNVTCASWEDIWLNESFASYGEYMSLQAFSTATAARSWMDDAQDRAQTTASGTVRVPDTTNVGRIFSFNLTYKKGAAVVHMLRYLCHNDAKFYNALRTYQSQYSGRTARTSDMQRVFETELGGTSLTYFFDQWYRGEGFPSFAVRWNQVGTSLYIQNNETASLPNKTPFFRTEVDYKLTFQSGTTTTIRLNQTQASQGFTVPVSGTVTAIAIDPDGWLPDLNPTVRRDATLVLSTVAQSPTLALYPNPVHDQLTIDNLTVVGATAEVVDALGRCVLRQPISPAQPQLTTQGLAPGLYILRLTGEDGSVLGRGRLVKD